MDTNLARYGYQLHARIHRIGRLRIPVKVISAVQLARYGYCFLDLPSEVPMQPDDEAVRHLLDDHSLTVRDIAVMLGCREDLLHELVDDFERVPENQFPKHKQDTSNGSR